MKSTVYFDKKTGTPKAAKLDLTKEEAQWLRALVQNPVGGSESKQEAAIRRKFFTAVEPFVPGSLI